MNRLLVPAAVRILAASALATTLGVAAAAQGPESEEPTPGGGWWNLSGFVEALSLTEAQRAKMDASLARFRKTVTGEGRETLEAFHDALAAGAWDDARSELEALTKRSADQMRARGELKLDILRVLSDEQRGLLSEKYPGLIRQAWGRPAGRGRR